MANLIILNGHFWKLAKKKKIMSVYVNLINKVLQAVKDGQDTSRYVSTIADMMDAFLYIPEFFELPYEIIAESFKKSDHEFTKVELLYIVESMAYKFKLSTDQAVPPIKAAPEKMNGDRVVQIIGEYVNWEPNPQAPLAEPPYSSEIPPLIYELIKSRQDRRLKKVSKQSTAEFEQVKKQSLELQAQIAKMGNGPQEIESKTEKELSELAKQHQTAMDNKAEELNALTEDVAEVQRRLQQVISENVHQSQMRETAEKNKVILSDLNSRLATELDSLHDLIASLSGGKTSQELREEKAQKEKEELERKMHEIPKVMERKFTIPAKPTTIAPIYGPKDKTKLPKKIKTIFDAIALNDIAAVRSMLEKSPRLARELGDNRTTPLHEACKKKAAEIVQELIAHGADVNAKDMWSMTPLHYAGITTNETTIAILIDNKADRSIKNRNGLTALDLIEDRDKSRQQLFSDVENGDKKGIAAILKKWPDMVHYNFNNGMTPMHLAAAYEKPDVMELLLQWGANINIQDDNKETPFHYACKYGKDISIQFLIDHGADCHALNNNERMPFDFYSDDEGEKPEEKKKPDTNEEGID